ncbi:MAG: hypothetical protein HOP12_01290 [Candidatus Eisenbacteria bacterium]|uniref:Tetratricopeptide repeat protein n=1 Tax=Eiseniibacteriota bacterium TaxID=2212470 RepID=A0A849SE67_UNCEI|nr:hypothetical protein [Candidatus Eisenbacteria bacterium]
MSTRHVSIVTAGALALLALLSPVTPARAASADSLATLRGRLQAAVNAARTDQVLAVRQDFQSLAAATPEDARLSYWSALSAWRAIGFMRDDKQRRVSEDLLESALVEVDRAIEKEPGFAENHALKSALLGFKIQFGGMALGMTLGPEMARLEERAETLAPANPRVLLLRGMMTLHRPAFIGGGAKKALPILEQAIAAFEAASATDARTADWGRDDAHVWAGNAARKLDDPARAIAFYERALVVNPEMGWARKLLDETRKSSTAKGSAGGKRGGRTS